MSLYQWITLSLPTASLASFLAVGPPASPILHHLGSANESENIQPHVISATNRYQNSSDIGVYHKEEFTTQNGRYFWLADAKFKHQVEQLHIIPLEIFIER
jgi:hypothetical protein